MKDYLGEVKILDDDEFNDDLINRLMERMHLDREAVMDLLGFSAEEREALLKTENAQKTQLADNR